MAAIVERGPRFPAEAFNVASGAPVTMDEYAAAIATALGCAPVAVPDDSNLRNYERQGVVDTSKAERLLDFAPTPLDVFVGETVRWHAPLLEGGPPQ